MAEKSGWSLAEVWLMPGALIRITSESSLLGKAAKGRYCAGQSTRIEASPREIVSPAKKARMGILRFAGGADIALYVGAPSELAPSLPGFPTTGLSTGA